MVVGLGSYRLRLEVGSDTLLRTWGARVVGFWDSTVQVGIHTLKDFCGLWYLVSWFLEFWVRVQRFTTQKDLH